MRRYRRLHDSDTWHYCSNCSQWPTRPGSFIERTSKPTSGELHNECRSKDRAGSCRY